MQNDHNLFETQSRDICTPLPLEDLNILDVQLLGHAVRQLTVLPYVFLKKTVGLHDNRQQYLQLTALFPILNPFPQPVSMVIEL